MSTLRKSDRETTGTKLKYITPPLSKDCNIIIENRKKETKQIGLNLQHPLNNNNNNYY